MPIGFGRIIRDDAGSVIGVELNDDKPDVQVDPEDVDDVDSRIDPDVRRKWVKDFTQCATGITPQNSSLIKGEPHFCVPWAPLCVERPIWILSHAVFDLLCFLMRSHDLFFNRIRRHLCVNIGFKDTINTSFRNWFAAHI